MEITLDTQTLNTYWHDTFNHLISNEIVIGVQNNILKDDYKNIKIRKLDTSLSIFCVPTLFCKYNLEYNSDKVFPILEKISGIKISTFEIVVDDESKYNHITPSKQFLTNLPLPQFNFSNFVVGKSNAQAHISATSCANHLGKLYNPLIIYGNSGLGKTHLLNSIGNFVINNSSDKKVSLLTGEEFVNHVFLAKNKNNIHILKKEFTDIDLLLIDDIHFMAGKEKSLEVFLSVFNELIKNNKQIVITCDRLPQEIHGLEERIVSRFNSGLKVNVSSPNYETSIDILKSKINDKGMNCKIEDDALGFIATNFSEDVRALEGALNRLLFYSINFSNNDSITFEDALNAFQEEITDNNKELNSNKIIKTVCDYYGINKKTLLSKTRTNKVSIARHICVYIMRTELDFPFTKIGLEMGNRDHSTIMNSCNVVSNNLNHESYKKAISEIMDKLKFS